MKIAYLATILLLLNCSLSYAQAPAPSATQAPAPSATQASAPSAQPSAAPPLAKVQDWQLLDFQQDTVYGASVNRVYQELLRGRTSQPVIVAVIDEGVDITHEDLQGHIWTNPGEIPGNGIDDEKDGYVDDVHGWNFLGNKDGRNIYATNSEADREYARLLTLPPPADSLQRAYFIRVKNKHISDSISRHQDNYKPTLWMYNQIAKKDSILKAGTGLAVIYQKDLVAFQTKDSLMDTTRKQVLDFYRMIDVHYRKVSIDSIVNRLWANVMMFKNDQKLYAAVKDDPFEERRAIVGDDPSDINDRCYGNGMVGDEYADHGTHCAGIIGATRGNGIGMDGVADHVIILPVRAVNSLHFGDEMDKDVALAIRYAVDHGARIISMSFGKDFSPHKAWVDDAIKYAASKGVLIVHAAGNDHNNNDNQDFYPSPAYENGSGRAPNLLTVGAISSDTGYTLTASFSNYGQKNVDLFAPGVNIYSCIPGNKYEYFSGTSMAAPVVAGVAALLLEYFPQLTAVQLKQILMQSVTPLKGKMVYIPGTKRLTDFGTLSVSGGVVNAYQAFLLAARIPRPAP